MPGRCASLGPDCCTEPRMKHRVTCKHGLTWLLHRCDATALYLQSHLMSVKAVYYFTHKTCVQQLQQCGAHDKLAYQKRFADGLPERRGWNPTTSCMAPADGREFRNLAWPPQEVLSSEWLFCRVHKLDDWKSRRNSVHQFLDCRRGNGAAILSPSTASTDAHIGIIAAHRDVH
jgi:hypothetical protein